MKKLLAMALCLVAVSGYAQKGKEKIAADFYGVDYSCVDVKGADEEPGAFIKAFEAINRLFLSEPKKYDVAGFTGIDILSTGVEQANESLGALAAEQFTPRSAATDWQTQLSQIVARYDFSLFFEGVVNRTCPVVAQAEAAGLADHVHLGDYLVRRGIEQHCGVVAQTVALVERRGDQHQPLVARTVVVAGSRRSRPSTGSS